MPLYEYNCQSCENTFTELRSSSEMDEPIECPDCGESKTHRVLSGFAVGSGAVSAPATPNCGSSGCGNGQFA